jgi:hypothetical protein
VVTWGIAVFLANLGNYALGIFPTRLLVITSVVSFGEIMVAALVGAWLYKEEDAVQSRRLALKSRVSRGSFFLIESRNSPHEQIKCRVRRRCAKEQGHAEPLGVDLKPRLDCL